MKKDTKKNKKRTRKRNIFWFNPPFSVNVATNIGKMFFGLLHTCFPTNNKLHQILNKNTENLSYSCMQNIKQIISSHKKTVLQSTKIATAGIKNPAHSKASASKREWYTK